MDLNDQLHLKSAKIKKRGGGEKTHFKYVENGRQTSRLVTVPDL